MHNLQQILVSFVRFLRLDWHNFFHQRLVLRCVSNNKAVRSMLSRWLSYGYKAKQLSEKNYLGLCEIGMLPCEDCLIKPVDD